MRHDIPLCPPACFAGDHAIESVLKQQNGQQHHLYQQGSHRSDIKRKRLSVKRDQQQSVDEKTVHPKMAHIMLLFRRSTFRIARAAMVIDRFVISL